MPVSEPNRDKHNLQLQRECSMYGLTFLPPVSVFVDCDIFEGSLDVVRRLGLEVEVVLKAFASRESFMSVIRQLTGISIRSIIIELAMLDYELLDFLRCNGRINNLNVVYRKEICVEMLRSFHTYCAINQGRLVVSIDASIYDNTSSVSQILLKEGINHQIIRNPANWSLDKYYKVDRLEGVEYEVDVYRNHDILLKHYRPKKMNSISTLIYRHGHLYAGDNQIL